MRAILFDLGDTLLDTNNNPLPGAIELLEALADLRDPEGNPVPSGLVSDWKMSHVPAQRAIFRQEYLNLLHASGLDVFFQPAEQHVTLSTDAGVFKPAPSIFRMALDRIEPSLSFHHTLFITENRDHVQAARALGMMAIHFKGPGQASGEVENLADLLPLIQRMLTFSPCCKKHGEAVGRHASVANKNKQADAAISALVAQVSANRLRERIKQLSAFDTRWSFSNTVAQIPPWIRDRFVELGYPQNEVRFQPFNIPGTAPQNNVLCGPDANDPGFVLICAHYDSLSETPSIRAPGADDNASGIAVLLEVAELLRTLPLRRRVLYAAFGGEEQGLFGSMACAEIAANEQWKIDVVLNLDMIAFQDPQHPTLVKVEYDQGNRNPGNDAAAKAFGLLMAQAAADYTTLSVEHTDIWNSDYMPFEAKGYACIGVFEGGENPGYHQTSDTLATLDITHLAEVAKMVVATVYQIAR